MFASFFIFFRFFAVVPSNSWDTILHNKTITTTTSTHIWNSSRLFGVDYGDVGWFVGWYIQLLMVGACSACKYHQTTTTNNFTKRLFAPANRQLHSQSHDKKTKPRTKRFKDSKIQITIQPTNQRTNQSQPSSSSTNNSFNVKVKVGIYVRLFLRANNTGTGNWTI